MSFEQAQYQASEPSFTVLPPSGLVSVSEDPTINHYLALEQATGQYKLNQGGIWIDIPQSYPGCPTAIAWEIILDDCLMDRAPTKQDKAVIWEQTKLEIYQAIIGGKDDTSVRNPQFRHWARTTFSIDESINEVVTAKTNTRGDDMIPGPLATRESLYTLISLAHIQANHGGRDETFKQVRNYAGWGVLKDLVHEYIQNCPTCTKARTSKAAPSKRSTAQKASTKTSTTAATKTSMDARIEAGQPLRLDTRAPSGVLSLESISCPEKCLHPWVQASQTNGLDPNDPNRTVRIYQGLMGGMAFLPSNNSGGSNRTTLITPPLTDSPIEDFLGVNLQLQYGENDFLFTNPSTAASTGIDQVYTDNAIHGTTAAGTSIDQGYTDNAIYGTAAQPMFGHSWAAPGIDPSMINGSCVGDGDHTVGQQQEARQLAQACRDLQAFDAGAQDVVMADVGDFTSDFTAGDYLGGDPNGGFFFGDYLQGP